MARSLAHFKPNTKVFDRWWPYRYGVVVKVLKTRLHVRWTDGEVWSYDQPHMQFLEKIPRRAVGRA